jgi:Holliday junction DNA helicase RuvB
MLALRELANRSRGTPRVANRLLRRVRDFAAVEGTGKITLPITQEALKLAAIDEKGLDEQDRNYLKTIIEVYGGGPAGVEAVAATMGEERDTLEDVVEPYLLQNAFVIRTRQGRRATRKAYQHLGLKWKPPADPDGDGADLFAAPPQGVDPMEARDQKDDWKDDRKPKGVR